MQRSLQLSPDQPLTLNYLGYTWIDHNRNLRKGLAMIEKAVRLKPDDGYIVDSLGWAHYRLGNFQEAVKYLEQAVELHARRMPRSTTISAMPTGASGASARRASNGTRRSSCNPEPAEAEKIGRSWKRACPRANPARPSAARRRRRDRSVPRSRSEVNAASASE